MECCKYYQWIKSISRFDSQDSPDAGLLVVPPEKAVVKFEDVKFGYLKDRYILDGLSFEAMAGKKIALVGGSGSG